MIRRRIGLAVTTAAIVLTAASCGGDSGSNGDGGSEGKVVLTYWGVAEDVDKSAEKIIAEFEKENPDIKVEWTGYPEGSYGTKVNTALAAGSPPDVGDIYSRHWMAAGKVVPLDDLASEYDIDLANWNQAIVGDPSRPYTEPACSYDDTLYCLGNYTGAVALLYNKDMFDAAGVEPPPVWPPVDVSEFVDMACQLSDPDKGVYGTAYGDPVTFLPWEMWVSEDGRTVAGYMDSAETIAGVEALAEGIKNKCAPSLSSFDPWEQGESFFAQKKLASVISGVQGLEAFEEAGITYGFAGNPTVGDVEPFFSIWTNGLGVFEGTDHPEEAKKFVAFYATEGQRIRAEVTGDLPLDLELAEEIGWTKDLPGRQEALEVVSHARPPVFIPDRWTVFGPAFDAFGYVVSGQKTAEEAYSDAVAATQDNLDKAWEVWDKAAGS